MDKRVPNCDICGLRDAEYVCRGCGRLICRFDFDLERGVCNICSDKYGSKLGGEIIESRSFGMDLFPWVLIFFGFLMVVFGTFLVSSAGIDFVSLNQSYVIIWPIPVIFTGGYGLLLGLIYLLLMFLVIVWVLRKFFFRS